MDTTTTAAASTSDSSLSTVKGWRGVRWGASRAARRTVYGYSRISTAVIRYESAVTRTVNQRPRWSTVRDGCQYSRIRYGTAVPAVRKTANPVCADSGSASVSLKGRDKIRVTRGGGE